MNFENHDVYKGQWAKDKMSGEGEMHYEVDEPMSTGHHYVGQWKGSTRYGEGTMSYDNGDLYKGQWKEDMRHGKGMITWAASGEDYDGGWINDEPDR